MDSYKIWLESATEYVKATVMLHHGTVIAIEDWITGSRYIKIDISDQRLQVRLSDHRSKALGRKTFSVRYRHPNRLGMLPGFLRHWKMYHPERPLPVPAYLAQERGPS